jgi:hypothetical protein
VPHRLDVLEKRKVPCPCRHSNPDTAVKLTDGFEVGTRGFLFLYSLQTEDETRPASYRTDGYFSLEVKRPEHKTDSKSAWDHISTFHTS